MYNLSDTARLLEPSIRIAISFSRSFNRILRLHVCNYAHMLSYSQLHGLSQIDDFNVCSLERTLFKKSTPFEWFVDHMWLNIIFCIQFLPFVLMDNCYSDAWKNIHFYHHWIQLLVKHGDHSMPKFQAFQFEATQMKVQFQSDPVKFQLMTSCWLSQPFLIFFNVLWFINCQSLAVVIRYCFDLNAIVTIVEHSDKVVSYIIKECARW